MPHEQPQQYYMVVDEQPTGPLTLDEITLHPRLTPETLVWKPGIENWVPAHTLPELTPAFGNQDQKVQTPPEYSQNPYQNNSQEENRHNEEPGDYNRRQNPYHDRQDYNYRHDHYQGNQGFNHYGDNRNYRNDYNRHYQEPRNPYQNDYRPGFRTNWLPWAIVATVFGFFTSCIGAIFGIIGIVQANKANNLYARGYEHEGDAANSNARIMTIIGLIFAGLGILALIFFGNFVSALSNLSYY